jgi:uracil-DNA glycosylase
LTLHAREISLEKRASFCYSFPVAKHRKCQNLEELLHQVRLCRVCEAQLPLGPKPVLRASETSRILIVGQAPGTRVHATGIPWNDPSGDRLRQWMQTDRETFYDTSRISIIPMGLCYPGKGKSGDLPPRKECAELWLGRLLDALPNIELSILCGQYAVRHYLGNAMKSTLGETVRAHAEFGPRYFPLPHPSPRNIGWLQKNEWFAEEVIPALRKRVSRILRGR